MLVPLAVLSAGMSKEFCDDSENMPWLVSSRERVEWLISEDAFFLLLLSLMLMLLLRLFLLPVAATETMLLLLFFFK